ncbi:8192_t:CDS:2 [Scutellospora calospora]|uniref:8192_t:CDS:1 n=1 Tax=Scutellospora calospora TaxID=85575 RepID=A0ACA9KSL0_9GLOM|nr:8192_t:CDS:2 [Scutellospora calospora]
MNSYAVKRDEDTSYEDSNEISSISTTDAVSITSKDKNPESEGLVPYTLDNSKADDLIQSIPEPTTSEIESSIINNTSDNISINHTSTTKLCEIRETLDKNDITQINTERENHESSKNIFKRIGKMLKKRIKKAFR